ncbi:MAG: hypothetical protein LQ338_004618 [Usnochroma carphineum]|nr:MAG: hypothetical protein LQ338_004618 [Usnochroma carphineum]
MLQRLRAWDCVSPFSKKPRFFDLDSIKPTLADCARSLAQVTVHDSFPPVSDKAADSSKQTTGLGNTCSCASAWGPINVIAPAVELSSGLHRRGQVDCQFEPRCHKPCNPYLYQIVFGMEEDQADDSDIKLQRDSASIIEDLKTSIPLFLYRDAQANKPVRIRKWVKQSNTAKLESLVGHGDILLPGWS